MNNELFDRMIKENLQEMQVAPSAGVKKALGWKLFFQNLVVFHKIKVAMGLLLATSATTFYFVTNNNETGEIDQYLVGNIIGGDSKEQVSVEDKFILVTTNDIISEVEGVDNEKKAPLFSEEDINETSNYNAADKKLTSDLSNNISDDSDKESSASGLSVKANEPSSSFYKSEGISENLSKEELMEEMAENEVVALFQGQQRPIDLQSVMNLSDPQEAGDLSAFFPPVVKEGVYKELSFDLYKGAMGQSEITSSLESAIHREFYWDFYGENELLKINVLGGANVNYTIGSGLFRLKASTGISYYQLNDNHAQYEFHEITDEAWLEFFNTDELSWVNTFGEDTCMQCFYAQKTEELMAALEEDRNQYSYLRIPLQMGTQLNFKYFSLDLMGGLDMNLLTNAKGLYVQEGLNPNYERFYYWDDLQLTTLSKDNDMLKKSFSSWSAAANLRVRVTKNFDLLAGYQINKSMNGITKDSYIMDKSLKSSNVTLGLTFYPTRKSIIGGEF